MSFSPQTQGQSWFSPTSDDSGNTVTDSPQNTNAGKNPLNLSEYDSTSVQEDDIFSYEEDFLTRKLFQRELPPLTQKERIIWSFRMADTNAFL